MRRAIAALLGTATGTVLLVGAKAGFGHPNAPVSLAERAHDPKPSTPVGSAAPVTPGVPPKSPAAGSPTRSVTTAPGAPTQGTTKTTAPPPAPRKKKFAPGDKLRDGTFQGSGGSCEWGYVTVKARVSGGRLVDVMVDESPSDHSRSIQINQRALPALRSEALAAQSANIDTVSGASCTSNGYRSSLQSALDAAVV